MTPAQRQYDIDLAKSMREMANWVQKRSGKVAMTLRQGADRIDALSSEFPITTPTNQPASTPALQPVRD